MKKVSIIFYSLFLFFIPLISFAVDTGLSETAASAGLDTTRGLPQIAGTIIGYLLSLLGIVFLGLIIYGGVLWMTARGETKQVESAKSLIINAVIGLVIVIAAYSITYFVIQGIMGATISETAAPPAP